MQDLK
jgi:hypothetical protein